MYVHALLITCLCMSVSKPRLLWVIPVNISQSPKKNGPIFKGLSLEGEKGANKDGHIKGFFLIQQCQNGNGLLSLELVDRC